MVENENLGKYTSQKNWDPDVARVDNFTHHCGVTPYACMDSLSDFVIYKLSS